AGAGRRARRAAHAAADRLGAAAPPLAGAAHARHRHHRHAVGRRGEGEGRRPPRCRRGRRGPLPRRQQRRAHAGGERREDRPEPRARRRAPPGPHLHARAGGGDRPRGAGGRDRSAAQAGVPGRGPLAARQRAGALDHALPSRHRPGARAAARRGLLEGAQGMMLDVDHGTYPFVTSSSCVAGAAAAGAGLPPRAIDRVVGIAKAYTTRVGGGPFPTELTDALGERLRADGDEYGATTGRPRRCGWFDAVVVRQAAALSGVDGLAVTKLDVLTGIDPLRLCTAYELGGRRLALPPASGGAWERVVPQYDELPGWREPLGGARALADLPGNARRYLERLA